MYLYKPNTCLFGTQKSVQRRFGIDSVTLYMITRGIGGVLDTTLCVKFVSDFSSTPNDFDIRLECLPIIHQLIPRKCLNNANHSDSCTDTMLVVYNYIWMCIHYTLSTSLVTNDWPHCDNVHSWIILKKLVVLMNPICPRGCLEDWSYLHFYYILLDVEIILH
jgi:hypothetical protein